MAEYRYWYWYWHNSQYWTESCEKNKNKVALPISPQGFGHSDILHHGTR